MIRWCLSQRGNVNSKNTCRSFTSVFLINIKTGERSPLIAKKNDTKELCPGIVCGGMHGVAPQLLCWQWTDGGGSNPCVAIPDTWQGFL